MNSVINPRSQTARAVHMIREMIFSGALPAGSSHLESELAEQLAMSRTPVREAGLILEAQGLVEVRPRKGIRVISLSLSDVSDIYDILVALETRAAELVARRHLSIRELELLANAVDDMAGAVIRGDKEACAEAADAFSKELVHLSGNDRLATLVETATDQLQRVHRLTLTIRPLPSDAARELQSLYKALAGGHMADAAVLHRSQRQQAKASVLAALTSFSIKRF